MEPCKHSFVFYVCFFLFFLCLLFYQNPLGPGGGSQGQELGVPGIFANVCVCVMALLDFYSLYVVQMLNTRVICVSEDTSPHAAEVRGVKGRVCSDGAVMTVMTLQCDRHDVPGQWG